MGQFPVDQLLPTNHHCRKMKLKCILPVVRFSETLTETIVFVRNVKTAERGCGLRGEQVYFIPRQVLLLVTSTRSIPPPSLSLTSASTRTLRWKFFF